MAAEKFLNNYSQYIKALNNRDLELADRLTDEIMTINAITHSPNMQVVIGSEGQKKFIRETIAGNPDFQINLDESLVDGEKVILRGSFQGNNEITGAVESMVFIEIDRLEVEKIAETWLLVAPGSW